MEKEENLEKELNEEKLAKEEFFLSQAEKLLNHHLEAREKLQKKCSYLIQTNGILSVIGSFIYSDYGHPVFSKISLIFTLVSLLVAILPYIRIPHINETKLKYPNISLDADKTKTITFHEIYIKATEYYQYTAEKQRLHNNRTATMVSCSGYFTIVSIFLLTVVFI